MMATKSTLKQPHEIRGALLSRGFTVTEFAAKYGFNVHTVRSAIYGSRSGAAVKRIRAKIKEVCGE